MSPKMVARFKVIQVVRTSTWNQSLEKDVESVRAFITPFLPEYEGETDDDPVENVLWDVKVNAVPSAFDIGQKTSVAQQDCAEIEVYDGELQVGQLIDVTIEVVGLPHA